MTDSKPLNISYTFEFKDTSSQVFDVRLNPLTLDLIAQTTADEKPEWTRLSYAQCSNCPLTPATERCPVAANLVDVVRAFKTNKSYEQAHVTVQTAERTYTKATTLQKGISSILGLYMVTSGCPIMDKLRPMVRMHLPFANAKETFIRSISMYLIGQVIAGRKGHTPDWSLTGLLEMYKEIAKVNKGMSQRLTDASKSDANVNAVVILHSMGDGLQYFVDGELEEMESDYAAYFPRTSDTVKPHS